MRYLIDSHVAIWMVAQPELLGKNISTLILNPENQIWLSTASLWEISLKFSLGKLDLNGATPNALRKELEEVCQVSILDITSYDAVSFYQLKSFHHRDPFDRMMIWQSIHNDFTFITNDENIHKYKDCGLKVIW